MTLSGNGLQDLARQLSDCLSRAGMKIVTAESCTGGGVAYLLTSIPGSSGWFECSFVVYSNRSKESILGVNPETLEHHGAVSEAVALEMASGALERSAGDISIAVTGIAGPDGGTDEKPVGTVCMGWKLRSGKAVTTQTRFEGDRATVRDMAIRMSIQGAIQLIGID